MFYESNASELSNIKDVSKKKKQEKKKLRNDL